MIGEVEGRSDDEHAEGEEDDGVYGVKGVSHGARDGAITGLD